MIAIIGGLGAAVLWAAATLASSRSSRMLGSRVVLGWVMLVGMVVGLPLALLSPGPATIVPSTYALLALAGTSGVVGLQLAYAALRIGKVSIVAPIVATSGAVAALIAVSLGDVIGPVAAAMLAVIAIGVVLSARSPGKTDVPAGEFDVVADAIDEPPPVGAPPNTDAHAIDSRRSAILAIAAALVFGVGLVAAGKAASLVPVTWVALAARVVAMGVVVLPLLIQGRLRMTRAALPLIVIAGLAEFFGAISHAFASRDSVAIAAVMGSQFAAVAAVAAFLLFNERIGRLQLVGVVLIVAGVSILSAVTA
ncbi:MAG: DMT family transporter [Chloroflexi bacterium]|nr:DMT family transporter [Chloroflexota bacterium]